MADGSAVSAAPWPVPVVYSVGGRPATVLFDQATQAVAIPAQDGPVTLNAGGTGYYRVRYDAPLFDRQRRAFATLTDADRAALLSDTWALVQSDRAQAADYLQLLDQVSLDVHPAVWEHVLAALDQVRRLERGTAGQAAFERSVRQRLAPLAAQLGWHGRPSDSAAVKRLRPKVLGLLGDCSDPGVLAEARTEFAAYRKHPDALDVDMRETVIALIGRSGTPADFDALLALAKASEDVGDQHMYYAALASTQDPALAARALALSSAKGFDPTLAIRLVGHLSQQHPEATRAYFKQHAAQYLAGRTAQSRAEAIARAYAGFTDAGSASDLEAYAQKMVSAEAMPEIRKATTRIRFDAALKARLVPAFDGWATPHGKV
jgi:aminopeptidase N